MIISVITINYNNEKGLLKTINSVRALNVPDYLHLEFIVIDGGSTDGSVEVIRENKDIITSFLSEPDDGIYDAMNKGISISTGDWMNFMNSGDVFFDHNCLDEIFSGSVQKLEGVSLIYGDKYDEEIPVMSRRPDLLNKGIIHACHQSMFFKRIGLKYNPRYKIYSDYDLVVQYLKKDISKALYVPIFISQTERGGIGSMVSITKRKEKFSIVYKQYGILGFIMSIKYSVMKKLSRLINR
jgi:putative colanic acid biosynthesis glycosyltransferase